MSAEPAPSNRQKRLRRRAQPSAPRALKPVGHTVPPVVREVVNMPDRDGLLWLVARNRLSAQQAKEARDYRRDYRAAALDGVLMRSCLDDQLGGGGGKGGLAGVIASDLDAQRRLYRKRFEVLCGQANLLEVLDGVCGRGVPLRELAGGDGHKANAYEMLLKVALDMLAKSDVG